MSNRCPLIASFLVAAALCLAGSPSAADTAQEARELFSRAVQLFEQGEFKAAAEAFREAYNLRASWKMLYNIGQSEAAAGRYGMALEAFEGYLVQGKDDVPADRRDEVLKEIERMRLLVGVVDVQAPDGTELIIDDTSRGATPFSGLKRIEAGPHRVILRLGGQVIFEGTVNFAGGMTTPVRPADPTLAQVPSGLASAGTPVPPSEHEEPGGPSLLLFGGIASGVIGAAGIGTGIFFAVQGNRDYEDQQKARDAGDAAALQQAKDRVAVDRVGTIVGFTAGGALLVTGVTLIVVDRVRSGKKQDDGEESALIVRPAPGGLAVSF